MTEKGLAYVGDVSVVECITNKSVQEFIKKCLTPKERILVDLLVDGMEHNKMEVETLLKYDLMKLSGYDKMLSKMNSRGFLTRTKSTIQLADKFFPECLVKMTMTSSMSVMRMTR